jgi:hypothetical protein
MDVSEQLQQVGVCFYQDGLITAAEERAVTIVGPIEALRVYPVDMSHEPRKIGIRGLRQQVVMVRHQAERGNSDIPHKRRLSQQFQEALVILPIAEDHFATPATVHDVVPCIRILYAQGP